MTPVFPTFPPVPPSSIARANGREKAICYPLQGVRLYYASAAAMAKR